MCKQYNPVTQDAIKHNKCCNSTGSSTNTCRYTETTCFNNTKYNSMNTTGSSTYTIVSSTNTADIYTNTTCFTSTTNNFTNTTGSRGVQYAP